MERIPEPELMDDEEQVTAYAEADFSSSNQLFVDTILKNSSPDITTILDIGCGPGDVPVRLALAKPDLAITAVDGSACMAEYARNSVLMQGMQKRIEIVEGMIPGIDLGDSKFDVIVSKDLIHHLPDPADLWNEIKRHASPGTGIFVMDLVRPVSKKEASEIVEAVSRKESEILRLDFYNSLLASYTPEEIETQLGESGLDLRVTVLGDRHFLVSGFV